MFMKWFPGSVLNQTICKFDDSFAYQRFYQILLLFLKAVYYIHKILTPKYWHVILKLAIFNGPKPLPYYSWNCLSPGFNLKPHQLKLRQLLFRILQFLFSSIRNSPGQFRFYKNKSKGEPLPELPYESHKRQLHLCLWCYNSQKCC